MQGEGKWCVTRPEFRDSVTSVTKDRFCVNRTILSFVRGSLPTRDRLWSKAGEGTLWPGTAGQTLWGLAVASWLPSSIQFFWGIQTRYREASLQVLPAEAKSHIGMVAWPSPAIGTRKSIQR